MKISHTLYLLMLLALIATDLSLKFHYMIISIYFYISASSMHIACLKHL